MTKKTLTFVLVLLSSSFFALPAAFAQTSPAGQASGSNILQDVQSAIQSLVSAKDTGNTNDVALRITAFEQVLALSKSETQNYELKLVNAVADKKYDAWKNGILDSLSQALAYYDAEDQLVNGTSTITTGDIKQIAADFENWRGATYLPLVEQIQDFLLVSQEADAVKTASTRRTKIMNDLNNLGLPAVTNSKTINGDLDDAGKMISAAGELNKQAADLFFDLYANATSSKPNAESATGTPSSTVSLEATPLDLTATSSASGAASSTATSTDLSASSTAPVGQATTTVATSSNSISIKGLVKASLDRIRNAYQDFIDISNLVRGLLK